MLQSYTLRLLYEVVVIATVWSNIVFAVDLPCSAQQAAFGAVCACNATYCDSIERPAQLAKGQYYMYSTSKSSPGFSQSVHNFVSYLRNAYNSFTINSSVQFQEILGFGGSFTGTVGLNFNSLPEGAKEKLIESYFSSSGIEYTLGRVPIGSSDFATRWYTLDDVDSEDLNLTHFALTEEEYSYKIPVIKKAVKASQRGFKLYGSPWTAPSWMKIGNDSSSAYIQSRYYNAFAEYFVKFIQAYNSNGIDVWAISGGNQLLSAFIIKASPMFSSLATPHRQWLKNHLSPALGAANLSHVRLLAMDDQRPFLPYWMDRITADPEVRNIIDGVGLHWYLDWVSSPSILDKFHHSFPEKLILSTESSINSVFGGEPVELGSWERAALYIYNIIQNFNHWTQGYIDWNLCLDTDGGPFLGIPLDAAIIVNKTSGEFYKQPVFYGIGHFSKFMPPGSRRIQVKPHHKSSDSASYDLDSPSVLLSPQLVNDKSSTPMIVAPAVVASLATANPDGSYTFIVFNNKNTTVKVQIEDAKVGVIVQNIEAYSINSFIYWIQ